MSWRFAHPVPVADGPCSWQEAGVNPEDIAQRLELLRVEHRDLDAAIIALSEGPVPDQLQLARLKKKKLRLRDEIAWCEDQIIPDIIA